MLINLSSLNEPDPAKFKNDFSDSMMIPKMSYICLVKAQIIRIKETKQIVIPPNTTLYFRWMAYDVSSIVLNFNGTKNLVFNLSQFVTELNNSWTALGFPAGYVVEALIEDPPGTGSDEKIVFKIIANVYQEGVIDFRWKDEVYADHGANNYFTVKYGQCRDDNNALLPFPPGSHVPGDDIQYFFSSDATFATGAIWDTVTRTSNANQVNKDAFSLLTTEILSPTQLNGYTPMNYYINQPNAILNISFGVSTTNANNPIEYLSGAYVGNSNFNPGNVTKSNILSLEYEAAQGTLQAKLFNDELGTFETNSVNYKPGDYFEVYSLVDHEGAVDLIDPQRAFYMNVNHYSSNGLVFAYQGNLGAIQDRPGNLNFFLSSNTTQPTTINSMNNMSYAFDGDHLRDKYYKQDNTNLAEFLTQWQTDLEGWQANAVIGGRVKLGRDGQNFTTGIGSGWVYNQAGGLQGYLNLSAGNNWTQAPTPATEIFLETDLGEIAHYKRTQQGSALAHWWEATSATDWNVYLNKPGIGAVPDATATANLVTGVLTVTGGTTFTPAVVPPTVSAPTTQQFLLSYEDGVSDYAQWRYCPAAQGFNNTDGLRRPGGGTQIEIPSTFLIGTFPFSCSAPTMICASFMFNVLAEQMIPLLQDKDTRTLIGNDNNRVLEIFLNQSKAFDWRLTLDNTTTITGTFVDEADNITRINMRSSDNTQGHTYNFNLLYYGSNINTFRMTVVEISKSAGGPVTTTYVSGGASTALPVGRTIAPYNSIGGINPLEDTTLTNYNDYSPLTYISNIRIFQSNLRADNTEGWGVEVQAMKGAQRIVPSYAEVNRWFTERPGQSPQDIDFYPNATNAIIVPTIAQGTQDPYNNVGFTNSPQNVGVFLSKPQSVAPLDLASPIINNLFIPANQILRDNNRVTTLSTDAYAGIGQGLVEVDLPTGSGSADMLDFIIPEPDVNGNIIQVPRVLAPNPVPPNDWTTRITADTEISQTDNEVMNVEITNLPHRTLNGANKSYDKTIYQMPMIQHTEEVGNDEIIECTPPSKVWIPLNNAMEIPLNRLDVQISTVDGKKIQNLLRDDTNITIQIEDNINLLN
tara:strand:- start:79 stop:3336 length:3258 start_codon:yes stop_codon:yes gene_type:complete